MVSGEKVPCSVAFRCQPWPLSRSKSLLFADDDAAMGDTGGSGSATVDTDVFWGEDGDIQSDSLVSEVPHFCVCGSVFFFPCMHLYLCKYVEMLICLVRVFCAINYQVGA